MGSPNESPDFRKPKESLLSGILRGLFHIGKPAPAPPAQQPTGAPGNQGYGEPKPDMVEPIRAPQSGARNLERVLAQFESMPEELTDLKHSIGDVLRRFDEALAHLGGEARRLSQEASALALVADRLQTRLGDLSRAMGQPRAYAEPARAPEPQYAPEPSEEPQFHPSEQGATIILAAVPGFQGLMDVQRALNGLAATESASVVAFKNDEASIRVLLRQPVSARQIVEGLQASVGQPVLIEEARPESQRLRLRFVEREGRR
jgi:hypothetical protein